MRTEIISISKNLLKLLKNETLLLIGVLLALISTLVAPPGCNVLDYIDFRTLSMLFSLMTVCAALQYEGVFVCLGRALLQKVKSIRAMGAVLIACCFFSSMFITNDVALISFVPLTLLSYKLAATDKGLLLLIVLETLAANLGSMLLPTGNPQNLFLYEFGNFDTWSFTEVMLPPTLLAAVALSLSVFLLPDDKINKVHRAEVKLRRKHCIFYTCLFLLCLAAVIRILPIYLVNVTVFLGILFTERKILKQVDYSLLLTFVAFFIFVGNIANIPSLNRFLTEQVSQRALPVGILLSQVISNVPAALLLANFSNDARTLLLATNLGGLGSLIASMASLISYKFLLKTELAKGRYLLLFTLLNLLFLAYLSAGLYLLKHF